MHITLVSPYPELTQFGTDMIPGLHRKGITLEVIQAIGAQAASNLHITADVAICRGVTGVALRKVLAPEIPLIEVKTTGYDVMQAIHECRSCPDNPRPYTVIGTRNMVYGLQHIKDILGLELEVHLVGSEEEARRCFEERMRHGPRTIIGGSTVVGIAGRQGVRAVLIRSGRESLQQAVEEAIRVATVAMQERTAMVQTRISLDSLAEGLVMANDRGIITECNRQAAALLCRPDVSGNELVGRELCALLPAQAFGTTLPRNEDFILTNLGDGQAVAISYFPVIVGGVFRGGVATIQETSRVQELEGTIRYSLHAKGLVARYTFDQCVGKSAAFLQALEKARRYSLTQASVLIYGETGTGKEIVAQSMHNASPRRKGPFVAANCAAFPEALLESLLFGYVEGAFTGAVKGGKPGLFELAHGGTLFLDEVSEIPLPLQGRLLRVLQEQEIMRLGHDRVIPVDVRIIAATNRPLMPLIEQRLFRNDLFYRINVLGLTLPPLRERGRDVDILARHFLRKCCQKNGRRTLELTADVLEQLRGYAWPGNVRELRNLCERLSVLAPAHTVDQKTLLESFDMGESRSAPPQPAVPSSRGTRQEAARLAAREALAATGGNKSLAAHRLGVSRTTLWRMLKKD